MQLNRIEFVHRRIKSLFTSERVELLSPLKKRKEALYNCWRDIENYKKDDEEIYK